MEVPGTRFETPVRKRQRSAVSHTQPFIRNFSDGASLGYARVSPLEQNADLQRDALKAAGCYRIFVDTASGKLDQRPQLTGVLDQLRPGDTFVVRRLDRLGRPLRHLIDTVTALAERNVDL
jgi:DNA invertase Pin-like site-specific DNA recombinase